MYAIFRDIRYGFRSLLKSPGLTLVATAALTLGIAVTATMFSIVYGVLLIGLPYPGGDRIVRVQRSNPARGDTRMDIPIADYTDYRAQQTTLAPLAAYYTGTVNVSGTGDAERYGGAWVTASTFDVASAQALRGRVLQADDNMPSGPQVAVIGHAMWQQRFGGDTGILGRVIRANGAPVSIVGVMPEKFLFPDGVDLWLPLQMDPHAQKRGDGQWLTVVGKRKPGVTVNATTADFDRIARRLQHDYKETNAGIEAGAQPYIDAALGPEPRQLLYTMLGAVLFVLLIACANVANLLLDRAAHKSREVGIRTALGATRAAVVRQFLTEALLLSVAGAVLGTALAQSAITMFNRVLAGTQPPYFIDIRLHPAVLAFVVAVTALATLLSGALPAFQSSRTDINEVLKDEARGSSSLRIGRMSRGLVVFEIALSCALLVASGLMIKSVAKLRTMDPGFRTQGIFTARLGFPATYNDTLMQRQFFTNLRERLATLPGVRNAAIMSVLPGTGADRALSVSRARCTSAIAKFRAPDGTRCQPDISRPSALPTTRGAASCQAMGPPRPPSQS
jgi:putative ABC transport system permease protein